MRLSLAIPENYRTATISIFLELLSRLSELLLDGRAGAKAPDRFSCRITELLDLEETRLPVVLDPIIGAAFVESRELDPMRAPDYQGNARTFFPILLLPT
jgi:hypothetical protein